MAAPQHHRSASLTTTISSGVARMETIKSRFGDVTVDTEKALQFPRGLLGMPDRLRFALAQFPNPRMGQFMLLQSLDDPATSFITLPLELQNAILAPEDVKSACRDLQIPEPNLALLLIVSVHRSPDQVRLSANARAPLFIDAERRLGVQYVFQQEHYKVQHML